MIRPTFVIALFVIAVGFAPWSVQPVTGQEPESEQAWAGDYDKVASVLCSSAADAIDTPTFGPTTIEQRPGFAGALAVRRGLLVNKEGEVFRIHVIGRDQAAVEKYTDSVKMCLDQIPVGGVAIGESGTSDGGSAATPTRAEDTDAPSPDLSGDPADLIIEIYFWGRVPADNGSAAQGIAAGYDTTEWVNQLATLEFIVAPESEVDANPNRVIDFAIDPEIDAGVWQTYYAQYVRCVTVGFDADPGNGAHPHVYHSGGGTVMSHCGSSATHGLSAHGTSNGTLYAVWGRWYSDYYDLPPE